MPIDEKLLNIFEMVIRSYDNCFTCSAHMVILDDEGKEISPSEMITKPE